MVTLKEIDESNWLQAVRLSVTEEQQKFLDRPTGILARGYVYRDCNARVFAICEDDTPVGLALVRDLTEEPACYELQQFMIDRRFQNRGLGSKALELILSILRAEGRFDRVEVCTDMDNAQAIHVYQKAGFVDTGYIDPDLPHCLNLMRRP